MASFALLGRSRRCGCMLVQLSLLGIVNSLQFTAMNTLTLKDLDGPEASSGNSMLSMVQMLAMSLAVAAAAGLLAAFTDTFGHAQELARLPGHLPVRRADDHGLGLDFLAIAQ